MTQVWCWPVVNLPGRGRRRPCPWKLEEGFLASDVHVVSVDRVTHLLYFPLKDIAGLLVNAEYSAAHGVKAGIVLRFEGVSGLGKPPASS